MGLQIHTIPTGKPSITTVEVEVNGQRVTNGSVISAVGPMRVTSQQNVRVIVNGIEWVPVSRDGNTEIYSLTVGGRIIIFSGDKLASSFLNEYTPEFTYLENQLRFVLADGTTETHVTTGVYNQVPFPALFQSFRCAIYPKEGMESISGLEISMNQEGVLATKEPQNDYLRIRFSGTADTTRPLEIYLGNVLIEYILPT